MPAVAKSVVVSDVAELRDLIQSRFDRAYVTKMLHAVPVWPSVKDRGSYLADVANGQVVLDLGCTGALSARLKTHAVTYYGVDYVAGPWVILDLDRNPDRIPVYADVTRVIVSELLEHLSNPGRFLEALRAAYPGVETYITAPNAGAYSVYQGCEMVNQDHVAWYSYTTLLTLVTRAGYVLEDCCWYNGVPHKAEGIIMRVRAT